MTTEIGVRELKNNATRIVRAVREEQAEYIVTVHGKPAAILRPLTPDERERLRKARAEAFLTEVEALGGELAAIPSTTTLRDQLAEDRSAG